MKPFAKYYDYLADVFELSSSGGIFEDEKEWVKVHSNVPCRISRNRLEPAEVSQMGSVRNTVTLYTSPDFFIKPGSLLEITDRTGRVQRFRNSGETFTYSTHNETRLELIENV